MWRGRVGKFLGICSLGAFLCTCFLFDKVRGCYWLPCLAILGWSLLKTRAFPGMYKRGLRARLCVNRCVWVCRSSLHFLSCHGRPTLWLVLSVSNNMASVRPDRQATSTNLRVRTFPEGGRSHVCRREGRGKRADERVTSARMTGAHVEQLFEAVRAQTWARAELKAYSCYS